MKNEKLKIVVVESPYDTWSDPRVGRFLMDFIGVKLRAYGQEYEYGVLPVDGADLISTHLTLCREEEDQSLTPILVTRWTSIKKTSYHFTNFPGMSLLQQAGATFHQAALEQIIQNVKSEDKDLIYIGSLSIDPKERTSKERSVFLREIFTAMVVHQQRAMGSPELLAGGTCRFKIEKWLGDCGWKPLSSQEQGSLDPINVKHLAGERVQVMHLQDFSFEALSAAQKWQQLWDERLLIEAPRALRRKEAS